MDLHPSIMVNVKGKPMRGLNGMENSRTLDPVDRPPMQGNGNGKYIATAEPTLSSANRGANPLIEAYDIEDQFPVPNIGNLGQFFFLYP